jgi:hypothetical protein
MTARIYTLFSYFLIAVTIGYVIGILTYACEHFRIEYKESIWEKATDEEVIVKIWSIVKEFDDGEKTLYNKEEILKKAIYLNKYNLQFRIRCFKEGVKNRMNKMLNN